MLQLLATTDQVALVRVLKWSVDWSIGESENGPKPNCVHSLNSGRRSWPASSSPSGVGAEQLESRREVKRRTRNLISGIWRNLNFSPSDKTRRPVPRCVHSLGSLPDLIGWQARWRAWPAADWKVTTTNENEEQKQVATTSGLSLAPDLHAELGTANSSLLIHNYVPFILFIACLVRLSDRSLASRACFQSNSPQSPDVRQASGRPRETNLLTG